MEIYLVRHGIAEDIAQAGGEDSERRLTTAGIEKTSMVAKAFSKRISGVELILHSPYRRAVETAHIFSPHYPEALVKEVKSLTPLSAARATLPLLSSWAERKKIMLVGHEPHLSSLASLLITGSERPILEFRKAGIAGIACFDGSFAHGYLMFLLSPKFLG